MLPAYRMWSVGLPCLAKASTSSLFLQLCWQEFQYTTTSLFLHHLQHLQILNRHESSHHCFRKVPVYIALASPLSHVYTYCIPSSCSLQQCSQCTESFLATLHVCRCTSTFQSLLCLWERSTAEYSSSMLVMIRCIELYLDLKQGLQWWSYTWKHEVLYRHCQTSWFVFTHFLTPW